MREKKIDLRRWFFKRKQSYGKLDLEDLAVNLGVVIGLSFVFWTIYTNSEKINNANSGIIRLGGVIQLILAFFIIRSLYKVLKNLRYGFAGLPNGYKLITMILSILFCFYIYMYPNIVVTPIVRFDYNTFNPINEEMISTEKNIKNPSYDEMINFILEDPTDLNEYRFPEYVCENFAREVVKNAKSKGIRAGLVHLESPDSEGHAIVAFETTDKGLYFLEPQADIVFSKEELDRMVEEGVYYLAPGGYYVDGMYWGLWNLSGYHIVYWNDETTIPSFEIVLLIGAIVVTILIKKKFIAKI